MLRLGLALRPRRADEAGHDTVHRDLVGREGVGEAAREADEAGFGGRYMHAVLRAGVGTHAADIDDGSGAAAAQLRQAGLAAVEGAVERHPENLVPFVAGHLVEGLFATE